MTEPAAAVFSALPDRALIRLEGSDWRSFLQGLLTQDVETMADGETRYAALLTPQGRLLHDLFISADGSAAWLDVAASTREALLTRLKMYRLRARVELAAVEGQVVALWDAAAAPAGWTLDPRSPALGWRGRDRLAPEGARMEEAGSYDRHRLLFGAPDLQGDALADKAYALEANLDLLNGVDFRKGCFVGQETTSRMKRRTVVKSRLLPIRFEGPPPAPGTEVLAGELRAGAVHSGADGVALALVRLDRAVGAKLEAGGRPVRLEVPGWAAEAVQAALAAPPA